MSNQESLDYQLVIIRETVDFSERTARAAGVLAAEYWVSPEYDELQDDGIDMGRSLLYTNALKAYLLRVQSEPTLITFLKERKLQIAREKLGESTPITTRPFVPYSPMLIEDGYDNVEEYDIVLDKETLAVGKGIAVLHDMTLGQALHVAAELYITPQHEES
jgi:hypothetical protein